MRTLVIRSSARYTIRAIAVEAADGGRDPCPTLQFFEGHARGWPTEMAKLAALLTESCENGPPHDENKFKNLKGTDGLYEFKTPQGLRLICFWDDAGLIICTHGYVKYKQKAPKAELSRGRRFMRDYFDAKSRGTLTHAPTKRTGV